MSRTLAPLVGPPAWSIDLLPASFDYTLGRLEPSDADPAGTLSHPALLAVAQPVHVGDKAVTFGDDFFDRIHYSFVLAALGNLISDQERTLYVWNAFRRAERLNSVTEAGTDGITVTGGPGTPPVSFPPGYEAAYVVVIGIDGPAIIDASYAFDWQTKDDTVRITGVRITAWPWQPDWSQGLLERLEWRTDVLQAYDAREQRRALRLAPRKTYEFEFFVSGSERRYAEATIWGWGTRTWALPVWPDGQTLATTVAAGTVEVPITTATRDYAAGSLVMLITDPRNYEVVEIGSVEASRLVLARQLRRTWQAGTMVYPARTARLASRSTMPRFTGNDAGGRVSFDLVDPVDYTADGGPVNYRGYPVLTRTPNWVGGLEPELQRKLAEIDNLIGARVYEDEAGIPILLQRMRWTLTTRAELEAFRRLLYALRGRLGPAWAPSWADDIVVAETIVSAEAGINIQMQGYTQHIAQGTGRRDIRIETRAGQVFYRRIMGSSELTATTERLVIDTPLGVTLQPADIAVVSFMALVRLDGDAVELAYWTGDVVDVALVLRSFQHDV